MSLALGLFLISTAGWFGYYRGRTVMKKELYKEYKLRADRGAEPLAIDILINKISD